MEILYLGPKNESLLAFLKSFGDEVVFFEGKINEKLNLLKNIDFIISYRYRYIINESIISMFENKIINLHISFLPWNRGADPNLWSFLEDTPKGVTIHYIDKGLDTGDIITQRQVSYCLDKDTLRTMYDRLTSEVEKLFKEAWHDIRSGNVVAISQLKNGTYHRLKDKEKYLNLLCRGWDTPVKNLLGKAK